MKTDNNPDIIPGNYLMSISRLINNFGRLILILMRIVGLSMRIKNVSHEAVTNFNGLIGINIPTKGMDWMRQAFMKYMWTVIL